MPASASAWFLRFRSAKRLARPLALQVFFPIATKFNWRDAGLGIRAVSSIQNGETAREAARPPDIFSGCHKDQLEGCRPRHPRGFFDPDPRNGSRGRSPSRFFFRVPQSKLEGCRPRHLRGFFHPDRRNGSRGRSPSRCFFRLPQRSTGGMPASASAWFLRSKSKKRLARPLALQVFFQGATKFNWRDAGLGIRVVSLIQIEETAREAARPPGVFSDCHKVQLEGCRPRHPRGFFDSRSEKRLANPLALQCFFRLLQSKLEGCRPRHPRGFFDPNQRNGSRGRSPSRCFFRVPQSKLEGCRPRHPRGFFDPGPGVLSSCCKVQLEGCRPRHPRGFFDPDPRDGSLGRSPSRCFFRLPQRSTGGMPASASAGFLRSRSAKRLARPLALQVYFSDCHKVQLEGCRPRHPRGFFDPNQ